MAKLAALAALPVVATLAVANTSMLVVDVKEGGPSGHRIVVPVPLFLAQAALNLAPAQATRTELPEEALETLTRSAGLLDALADCPDAELIRVEDGEQTVVIEKAGDLIKVSVDGRREQVRVNVPIGVVRDFVASRDSRELRAADVVAALKQVSNTDLVDVRDGNDHVRVYVW
ncbi:MAG: hypothetical protein KJ067_23705 [Vicinamibacteria bacterium]|jgi:hypothetical protein|nr:hypothetical protein [Vicinamibacteria bacterium]